MDQKFQFTRPAHGYAAFEKGGELKPWTFNRRELRPDDVAIKILYAGICHSDLHALNDGWAGEFPIVPGHEIMGEVMEVGPGVSDFKPGDQVLIGTIVDSCRVCEPCKQQMESYCRAFPTLTYDGIDRIDGSRTRGGFSDSYVADKKFVYQLPKGLDASRAAPLMCAGITVYSPLRHWEVGPGKVVGIVGIGGLGHLAVKYARAMGAHVVAFTTSESKIEEIKRLGAHEVVLSTDPKQMEAQAYRFDFILDTVSKSYSMDAFIIALKLDATLCSLGIPNHFDLKPVLLTMGRRRLSSSGVGGTKETKEMLEFSAEHGIYPDVEMVSKSGINEALKRLEKGDVRYRFVIDMEKSVRSI
jgi:alcohol dehydrogenase (NADP+)